MIEAEPMRCRANMIEAILQAHEVNQEIIGFIDTIVAECGKEKHSYEKAAQCRKTVCRHQKNRDSSGNGRGCVYR